MTESTKNKVQGAHDEKETDLQVLKLTAKVEHVNLPLEKLILRNNVRDEAEYDLPPLIASIERNGFRPSSQIVVHLGEDKVYEVLAGNRRTNALRTFSPEKLAEVLAATGGLVPCTVYQGLTPAQIEIIRCDHGTDEDRKPLSKWGLYTAVRRLLVVGLTQTQIAVRLGLKVTKEGVEKPNRSLVQIYANAAVLPDEIQAMLREYWLEGKGTIRQSDIGTLYKVWNEEYAAYGIQGLVGPKFRAKIAEIKDRGEGDTPTTKTLSASRAMELSKVSSSPVTRQLLVAATQADGSTLAALDAELTKRDQLMRQIDWLFKNKTNQIKKLLDTASEALKAEAEAEAAAAAEAAKTPPSLVPGAAAVS